MWGALIQVEITSFPRRICFAEILRVAQNDDAVLAEAQHRSCAGMTGVLPGESDVRAGLQ